MQMENIAIPRLLDEKERVLFFHLYELAFALGGLGLGIVLSVPSIGVVLGLAMFALCRYLKRKGWIETIYNRIYWYCTPGLLRALQVKLEGTPPNYLRTFSG